MVPDSPPMNPSPVVVAQTLVSVACVGTAIFVQLLPFQPPLNWAVASKVSVPMPKPMVWAAGRPAS